MASRRVLFAGVLGGFLIMGSNTFGDSYSFWMATETGRRVQMYVELQGDGTFLVKQASGGGKPNAFVPGDVYLAKDLLELVLGKKLQGLNRNCIALLLKHVEISQPAKK